MQIVVHKFVQPRQSFQLTLNSCKCKHNKLTIKANAKREREKKLKFSRGSK